MNYIQIGCLLVEISIQSTWIPIIILGISIVIVDSIQLSRNELLIGTEKSLVQSALMFQCVPCLYVVVMLLQLVGFR